MHACMPVLVVARARQSRLCPVNDVNSDVVKERGWTVFAEDDENVQKRQTASSDTSSKVGGIGGKIFAGASGAATGALDVGSSVKSRATAFYNDNSVGTVKGKSVGDT